MFKCLKCLVGGENHPAVVYLEGTTDEKIQEGEALKIVNGKVTKAGATDKVKYIAGATKTNGLIPCFYVTPFTVFETNMTVTGEKTFFVGKKLALATDALGVGDVSATGVATIFDFVDGRAVGDRIQVIFE